MPIKWRLEITRITNPHGNKSIVQDRQFEADTIREAKEKADDISKSLIEGKHPSLTGTGDLEWTTGNETNFIQKGYSPLRIRHVGSGIEIHDFDKYYTRIEPIGISLSEVSDYVEIILPF